MSKKKIAVLVGSLRKNSNSGHIANALIALAPESLELNIVEIGNLPLYNQDYDSDSPKEYDAFRAEIKGSDGFLFITPEHNRTMSAALKNAIDVASRPWGQNVWAGKPGAVVSSSIGPLGGALANHAVRQPMVLLDVHMMQQPEAYLGTVQNYFDENGEVNNEDTKAFLQNYINAFENWVQKF